MGNCPFKGCVMCILYTLLCIEWTVGNKFTAAWSIQSIYTSIHPHPKDFMLAFTADKGNHKEFTAVGTIEHQRGGRYEADR